MRARLLVLAAALMAAGCETVPPGPSVMALPGSGKSFDQFRLDDMDCRRYALDAVGGSTANEASSETVMRSAAVGTAVGAVAGAMVGGHQDAGSGAAAGLVVGTLAGTGAAQGSAYGSQRRYDNAYVQCMYAKGNQVPVSGSYSRQVPQNRPAYVPPPPPPGSPPPPPPGER